jgi:predicted acetyltransferase
MPDLTEQPCLVWPTLRVRELFLAGERADCLARGQSVEWLEAAAEDFAAHVASARGVRSRWGVPSSLYWYVWGEHYIGTLVIRHRLTAQLREAGGHIGFHVVEPWRRQGHATRMLAAGLRVWEGLELSRVLLTCQPDNMASRRVILANGGVPDGQAHCEDRFWISLGVGPCRSR